MLAVIAGFSITSCKNDDQEDISIVGTWRHTQMKVISGKDGSVLSNNDLDACDQKTTTELTENDTLKSNYYEFYNSSCNHYYEEYGYSYDKNAQKLFIDGETFSIKSLTEHELVMNDPEADDDYNDDGFEDIYEMHLTR
ncbi:lipocalin family protein [Chryseobacterium wangxinyae]|uniref:lipocalin family protein n=1 Tax=Chryseobacterium sp. CY353 TaxID=2997334 RepID=UPI0022714299|nr:lipocalin family protein [Chryseobacterium sp. CY353]MCY0970210.1 lipocalin family protein [Chryseobacterium sp. CY353]